MIEFGIIIIGFLGSYIASLIPGTGSAIAISAMILMGIPPQIAKTTFQIGLIGFCFGGMRQLLRSEHIRREYLIIFSCLCLLWGYIGGNILITIPTPLLLKLMGFFMIILLLANIFSRETGIISREISRKRKWIGYGIFFWWIFLDPFFRWVWV
jgi:uncharacterized membrane protein YfcA